MDSSRSITSTESSSLVVSAVSAQHLITKAKSRGLFKLKKNKSSSTPLSTESIEQTSTETIQSKSPIYNQRVTEAKEQNASRANARQKSSPLFSRFIWAAIDRKEFISAVSELSKGNELLERMLDIKPLSDPVFHGPVKNNVEDISLAEFNRTCLDKLHTHLLELNPRGNEVDFSIRLAIDANAERTTYSPLVDQNFDPQSSVFALQAHCGPTKQDRDQSLYLLAELPVKEEQNPTKICALAQSFHQIDPIADPAIKVIGIHPADGPHQNLRIYQDCTAAWKSTKSLSAALKDSKLRSSTLQRYHVQLALLVAFSFAILPCTYEGKEAFPQACDFVYYDQLDEHNATMVNENGTAANDQAFHHNEDEFSAAEDLLSPWYRFYLGSRPRVFGTKALGKRPGVFPIQQNPVVALGILLSQIGLWESLPVNGGITQMRKVALEKSHDLIRFAGVEFEDITRRCLDWKECGENYKRNNAQEMLQEVFSRLSEHNRALQRLL